MSLRSCNDFLFQNKQNTGTFVTFGTHVASVSCREKGVHSSDEGSSQIHFVIWGEDAEHLIYLRSKVTYIFESVKKKTQQDKSSVAQALQKGIIYSKYEGSSVTLSGLHLQLAVIIIIQLFTTGNHLTQNTDL